MASSRDDLHLDPDSEPLLELNWYHPNLTRHAAECMLIDNAPEGSYLMRPNLEKPNKFSLSVKGQRAVLHFMVERNRNGAYLFGEHSFKNLLSFQHHVQDEEPVIGGEGTAVVTLKIPYTRFVNEPQTYVRITYHARNKMASEEEEEEELDTDRHVHYDQDDSHYETTEYDPPSRSGGGGGGGGGREQSAMVQRSGVQRSVKGETVGKMLSVGSKEGYLTKLGRIIKSWRRRWFVLRNYNLSYFKTHQSSTAIRVVNLGEAIEIDYDNSKGKDNCFRVVFPRRTFYIFAQTPEDCQMWMQALTNKFSCLPRRN